MASFDTINISIKKSCLSNLKEILRTIYRPERFEDRDSSTPCGYWNGYSDSVTKSHLESINAVGATIISRHDTQSRQTTKINLVKDNFHA